MRFTSLTLALLLVLQPLLLVHAVAPCGDVSCSTVREQASCTASCCQDRPGGCCCKIDDAPIPAPLKQQLKGWHGFEDPLVTCLTREQRLMLWPVESFETAESVGTRPALLSSTLSHNERLALFSTLRT